MRMICWRLSKRATMNTNWSAEDGPTPPCDERAQTMIAGLNANLPPEQCQQGEQELWPAILNSPTHTARRDWNGQLWYVAWLKVPIGRAEAMRYRVATRVGGNWQGWQVTNISAVEYILVDAWLTDHTQWRQVWPGWLPMAENLEQITWPLQYEFW